MADDGAGLKEFDVLVVGAGFAGIYQIYRLRELGFSVRLFEAGAAPGGVWYWNRYPGARVDVSPPVYELSFEKIWKDWTWKEKFPSRDELVAYFQHAVKQLDLSDDIAFNSRVTAARFDTDANMWTLTVNDSEQYQAHFVVYCTGYASKPYIPPFKNIEQYQGEAHHSGLWPEGLSFDGKRVAVIGTGASGVQLVQEGAHTAAHLTVFQRTPINTIPMRQKMLSEEIQAERKNEYKKLFKKRITGFGGNLSDVEAKLTSQVSEEERQEAFEKRWKLGGFDFWAQFPDVFIDLEANRLIYDFWRDKVRERIHDPELKELLAPMEPIYPFGVKRPSLEIDYFEAFNQDNVELVNLRKTSIETFTPTGIRTSDGREFEFDIVVFATGFDAVTGGLTQIDIRGTDGQSLAEYWQDGVKTQMGLTSKGFPNMWFIYGPQSPNNACIGPTCAEVQGEWVVSCLRYLRDHNQQRFEATDQGQEEWAEEMDRIASLFLLAKGDNWQTGANIPGKKRQLLTHMDYLGYMDFCRKSEESHYADFSLG